MYDFFDKTAIEIKPNDISYDSSDYLKELKKRLDIEKDRKEIIVNYYRIRKKYVFSLPVENGWDKDLPVIVENIKPYPYAIWLLWTLRERWDTLYSGYVMNNDEESRRMLESEIIKAFAWDKFAIGRNAYLGTAHFAMCVSRYYLNNVFKADSKTIIRQLSKEFLDKHFLEWLREYEQTDENNKVTLLHNIQVILAFSGLSLARCIRYEHCDEILEVVKKIARAYKGSREGEMPFTEMAAYDSFTLDAITEYISMFSKEECVKDYSDELNDAFNSITDTMVPGRCDILAPMGDVEEEMQFHSYVIYRLSKWLNKDYGMSLLRKINPARLPSLLLMDAIKEETNKTEVVYGPLTRKNAGTVVMRTGYSKDDILVCLSVAKWNEGHVHFDSGSFIFAHQGEIPVSDPGYQQYIKGEERTFTIGKYSHNAPIINGNAQTKRLAEIVELSDNHVKLDLSLCYELCKGSVFRTFDLCGKGLTVKDEFYGMDDSEIEYAFTLSEKGNVRVEGGVLVMDFEDFTSKMKASFDFYAKEIISPSGIIEKSRIIHKMKIGNKEEISFKVWVEDV